MKTERYGEILNTLERLGLPVTMTDEDSSADTLAVINNELMKIAVDRENTTFDNRFKLRGCRKPPSSEITMTTRTGNLMPLSSRK